MPRISTFSKSYNLPLPDIHKLTMTSFAITL